MGRTSEGGANEVSVQLSECRRGDAQRVLTALCDAYDPEGETPELRRDTAGVRNPTVWSWFVDVARAPRDPEPASLEGAVAAELQGATPAVNTVERSLRHAFTVRQEHLVCGDQETDLRVRLESR